VKDVLAQEESKVLEESPNLMKVLMLSMADDPSDCFGNAG